MDFSKRLRCIRGQVVTVQEAAEIIGCEDANVKYLISKKIFTSVKFGSQSMLYRKEVELYSRSNRGPKRKAKDDR